VIFATPNALSAQPRFSHPFATSKVMPRRQSPPRSASPRARPRIPARRARPEFAVADLLQQAHQFFVRKTLEAHRLCITAQYKLGV
jgi:hypothetical protein